MSDSRLIVSPDSPNLWGALATTSSQAVLVHEPWKARQLVKAQLPIARSQDEMIERLAAKIDTDRAFARRWQGWFFYPLPLDRAVEVLELPR